MGKSTRHMTVTQTERDGPYKVTCRPCGDRNRRGGNATFGSQNTADLADWQRRHAKHGKVR